MKISMLPITDSGLYFFKIYLISNLQEIRKIWNDEQEKWYFSVVDVVKVLSQSMRPRKYWDDLKRKLLEEGSQSSEKIGQLKFLAKDNKY